VSAVSYTPAHILQIQPAQFACQTICASRDASDKKRDLELRDSCSQISSLTERLATPASSISETTQPRSAKIFDWLEHQE
jgi:hypothetical protein